MKRQFLKEQYRHYMRKLICEKYLKDPERLTILGENFVERFYFVVFETTGDKYKRLIIIENIDNPIFKELKILKNPDGYIVVNKADFAKIISKNIRKKLAQRGICSSIEIGLKANKYLCFHRLIACLYYKCLESEIHHINKDVADNSIINLVPLSKSLHRLIDNDLKNGENFARDTQFHVLKKSTKFNNTVASYDNVQKDIITLKNDDFSVKKIAKKLNRYIKKSKVYEIYNFYYYSKNFIEWLKTFSYMDFPEKYGKFSSCWLKIFQFERLLI